MTSPVRRTRAAIVLVATLLVTLLGVHGTPAQAAAGRQLVYGGISFPQHDSPRVKMLWFDAQWHYVGQQRANGGGYSIRLAPGTYHLQFVDQRPAWDTEKYAPTDVSVTVRSDTVHKNVTMQRGAAITGVATAHGKPLRGARVVAANKGEQSFATTADKRGRFAVAGLPQGQYCLFTYDRAKKSVGTCTWAGAVAPGQAKYTPVRLTQKAGSLTVFVNTDDEDQPVAPRSTVTVTSRSTGQWWTVKSSRGRAVFNGLYPGRYDVKYDGAGIWLTQSGVVRGGAVHPSRMSFGDYRLTERGAWIQGTVVDAEAQGRVLGDATVQLWSATGVKLAETTSDESGIFTLSGQIYTQSEVTIVVQPSQYTDYLGDDPYRCQYVRTEHPGFDVTENRGAYVGDLPIERKAPQTKVGCEA